MHQRQSQHLTEAITWSVVALSGDKHSVIKSRAIDHSKIQPCRGLVPLTGLRGRGQVEHPVFGCQQINFSPSSCSGAVIAMDAP
jgi:hypothetical protein